MASNKYFLRGMSFIWGNAVGFSHSFVCCSRDLNHERYMPMHIINICTKRVRAHTRTFCIGWEWRLNEPVNFIIVFNALCAFVSFAVFVFFLFKVAEHTFNIHDIDNHRTQAHIQTNGPLRLSTIFLSNDNTLLLVLLFVICYIFALFLSRSVCFFECFIAQTNVANMHGERNTFDAMPFQCVTKCECLFMSEFHPWVCVRAQIHHQRWNKHESASFYVFSVLKTDAIWHSIQPHQSSFFCFGCLYVVELNNCIFSCWCKWALCVLFFLIFASEDRIKIVNKKHNYANDVLKLQPLLLERSKKIFLLVLPFLNGFRCARIHFSFSMWTVYDCGTVKHPHSVTKIREIYSTNWFAWQNFVDFFCWSKAKIVDCKRASVKYWKWREWNLHQNRFYHQRSSLYHHKAMQIHWPQYRLQRVCQHHRRNDNQ